MIAARTRVIVHLVAATSSPRASRPPSVTGMLPLKPPAGRGCTSTGEDRDGHRQRHEGRSLGPEDPARHVGVHDVPRRRRRPAGDRVQVGSTKLTTSRGRSRTSTPAEGARRLDAARRAPTSRSPRRDGTVEAGAAPTTRSAAGTACARAIAAGSGCTCRRCSRRSAWPRSTHDAKNNRMRADLSERRRRDDHGTAHRRCHQVNGRSPSRWRRARAPWRARPIDPRLRRHRERVSRTTSPRRGGPVREDLRAAAGSVSRTLL